MLIEISGLVLNTNAVVLDTNQRMIIDRLPVAIGASFNSRAEEHNPSCLPNTRVQLLGDINRWVDADDSKSIFWLSGMAGTGKSTISRTLAKSLSSRGRLAASFFFKRGEADRGNLSKFVTTMSRQIVDGIPHVAGPVKEAIECDGSIVSAAVQEQFDRLLYGPLETAGNTLGDCTIPPIVIVVDALDECEKDDDIRLVIRQLSRAQSYTGLRLRFFLTSRPDLPVRLGFSAVKGTYQDLVLHEVPEKIIGHDLTVFFEHELQRIRDEFNASVTDARKLPTDWPGQPNIATLVDMAIPLFIFAATCCRFVSDRRCGGNPDRLLRNILAYKGKNTNYQLEATYSPVLEQQLIGLSSEQQDELLKQFRDIVGAIVNLESPLSIRALAQILGIPKDLVEIRLDMLHSVLDIPASPEVPVRLLHLSFRDFLVDPTRKSQGKFWINEKDVNRAIGRHCLRLMSQHLRQDICDLRAPGLRRSDVQPEVIRACLPSELQYSSTYWIYHLQKSEECLLDDGEVHQFLEKHLLHWLEALSLAGREIGRAHV